MALFKLDGFKRPFLLAGIAYVLLLLLWLPLAWWLSTTVVRADARRAVDEIRMRREEMLKLQVGVFAERWYYLKSTPEIIADSPAVRRAMAMPTHKNLDEANHYLNTLITRTMGDFGWVVDAEGRIVLASDAADPASLLGRSLGRHDFFLEALSGRTGRYFGYGSYTGQPGFYFSVPIRVGDDITGVAAVKVRVDSLDALFGDPSLLISDQYGVIIMSRTHDRLWHTLPDAPVASLDPAVRIARYGDVALTPFGLQAAVSSLLPAGLYLRNGEETPYLFLSRRDARLDRLTVHMLVPLPELRHLPVQRRFQFALIGGSGALALALLVLTLTYLQHVRRLGRQLTTANRELQRQADSDFLTGCANRRRFERVFSAELARSQRYGNALSVAIVDIDFFKRINDTYGHPVGDAGLVYLVDSIQAAIRPGDLLGRIGGEEFALMLPQTSVESARRLLDRLRAMSEQGSFSAGGQTVRFTVSIGFTAVRATDDLESALKRADIALYAAKQGGRNRVCTDGADAQPNA
ncbi:hypothetical protein GCM10007350_30730 [Jeongeupia chitinilytica]|uniref:diguanylate cyclase n=1 Tax=Jeongeupia chitinilytica TaxID=1041641 RepID=A0ABQ3H2R1_9NEIS|nr:hypothetical protein GCM10007350_30730 [Jeongeupia chitinilytica]